MELERIYTSQLYLEKLSNGIDPFTGEDLPEDSLYNNVSLCRSFRTAADLLGEIIANRGCVTPISGRKKKSFAITAEERASLPLSEKPIGISGIAFRLHKVLPPAVKSISAMQMTAWLESLGFLESVPDGDKGRRKVATDLGREQGIETAKLKTRDGREYEKNLYDKKAQQFVFDNLEAISAYSERVRKMA